MNELKINNYLKSKVENISPKEQLKLNTIRNEILNTKKKSLSSGWFMKLSYGLAFAIPLLVININNEIPVDSDIYFIDSALSKSSIYEITDVEFDSILAFSDVNIDDLYY